VTIPRTQTAASSLGSLALADERFRRGVHHQGAGEAEPAEACFRAALDLWPGCAAAWANLGVLHEDADELPQAIACYRQARAIDPTLYEAALNLGAVLARLQRFGEAEGSYRQAIALRPRDPAAWSNLGALLAAVRRDADAEACCCHALALDPGYDKARFNLSYVLLRQGRMADGLLCLEARPGAAALQAQVQAQVQIPRWAGEGLGGLTLLVVSDAGHGDMIQLARYAGVLRSLGAARLLLACPPSLTRLLARDAGFDQVWGLDEPMPRSGWDLWTPSMSLPYLCLTRLDNIPGTIPYLHADPAITLDCEQRLAQGEPAGVLRVGLAWRGNPLHENDAERSLPGLGLLAPLAALSGVRFVSLQCGAGADEAGAPPPGLALECILPAPPSDFAETAALVTRLDLVISVDTAVAHLAGALGTPVWLLLCDHKTDWRWLQARSDTPWYPGVMRLFRQPRPGDWGAVVAQVVAALKARLVEREAVRPQDAPRSALPATVPAPVG
jgi:Tfp pilus assembly protein PilF